jgi:hypothetical protein
MITCIKCNKQVKYLKGETAAYILFLSTIPLAYLFGWSMLTMPFLGIYLYIVRNSKRYICQDCISKTCPTCQNELSDGKVCNKCKQVVCPFCSAHQKYDTSVSWPAAIIGLLIMPVIMIAGMLFIWLLPMGYLIYVTLTSPRCHSCGETIYISDFGI